MRALRILPLILAFLGSTICAHALAPSGETWFTIQSPHFRVHHTLPLENYARALTQSFERALPVLEQRLSWKAPEVIDVVVMDPSDAANGLAMNYPNTYMELFAAPFNSDSVLGYYHSWTNELATHELTHIVANDTTRGFYKTLRTIFGSWVKPNGLQPTWLSEGLAVFQETSLTPGGRGRSPLLEALLREAVAQNMLDNPDYASLDRFNDGIPWWPGGNTQYLLGYTIQAIPAKDTPNLPGKVSFESADTVIFAPNRVVKAVSGKEWSEIWSGASKRLKDRFKTSIGEPLSCALTSSGRNTGGQALSPDGWIYFSEEDWNYGTHLARVRADSPCNSAQVERLDRKRYGGPTQVAVSPDGKTVAYAKDDPGFESDFSDLYLWSESGGSKRLTYNERARDPVFLDSKTLAYIRSNADTSQAIVARDLESGTTTDLYTGEPFWRLAALAAGDQLYFSEHQNRGVEKLKATPKARGASSALSAADVTEPVNGKREFERNPFLAPDGSVYFAASYSNGAQEIYRRPKGTSRIERIFASSSGFVDRPLLLADGRTLVVQGYGLNGLNLYRVEIPKAAPSASAPKEDLHEFLSGEKSDPISGTDISLPPSVPYSLETSGTSLWPHYWFPEIAATENGAYVGASTSGNDALNYHRYFGILQWDSRANFPSYRAFYRNRTYTTNFHFEANQTNNYFISSKSSNRNAVYSVEAIFPLWDFSISFGTAYRDRVLSGSRTKSMLLFQNIGIDRSGKTPSAISPNWGATFNNFTAVYPSSKSESTFFDIRPEVEIFFRGFHPSHSVSLATAWGISTNDLIASNYYQGGGPTPLSSSGFIVRGYDSDTLFGRKIATANLGYTFPIAQIYHGLGTNPIFLNAFGLRFSGDAGSAERTAVYNGKTFLGYERSRLFDTIIYGVGGDLIATGSIFYHVPVSVVAGVHYGTEKRYGGGFLFYSAISLGINRGTFRADHSQHLLSSREP